MAVVYAARRLKMYFQSHRITVKIDYLVEKILLKPNLARHMIAWSVELSEFGLTFKSREPIKSSQDI